MVGGISIKIYETTKDTFCQAFFFYINHLFKMGVSEGCES